MLRLADAGGGPAMIRRASKVLNGLAVMALVLGGLAAPAAAQEATGGTVNFTDLVWQGALAVLSLAVSVAVWLGKRAAERWLGVRIEGEAMRGLRELVGPAASYGLRRAREALGEDALEVDVDNKALAEALDWLHGQAPRWIAEAGADALLRDWVADVLDARKLPAIDLGALEDADAAASERRSSGPAATAGG